MSRPGFTRISFPYFMDDAEVDYVLSALAAVARAGWRLLPLYRFNHKTGEWQHRSRIRAFPGRQWLSDLSFCPPTKPPQQNGAQGAATGQGAAAKCITSSASLADLPASTQWGETALVAI